MSDVMTKQDNHTALDDEDVIAFLRSRPAFLIENPELFDILTPPAQHSGKRIVDFQQYMVKHLRADRDDVVQSTREIVAASRANMNTQARTHTAVLMMLEAQDFDDFIRTITMDMAAILNVDIISLVVEADGQGIPHVGMSGVLAAPSGTVNALLKDKNLALESSINGHEVLYGGGATLVKSQALVRLNITRNGPAALMALGSRDPNLFAPGQGTELLSFLGKVIERCFRIWLGLPQG